MAVVNNKFKINIVSKNNKHLNKVSGFEKSLVTILIENNYEYELIKENVLSTCVSARFIYEEDIDVKSKKYQWLDMVIELNIISFSLLEQSSHKCSEGISIMDIKESASLKSELVIQDIVKRLLDAPYQFPVVS